MSYSVDTALCPPLFDQTVETVAHEVATTDDDAPHYSF